MELAAAHVPAMDLLRLADTITRAAAAPLSPSAIQALRRQHPPQVAALIVAMAAEQRRAQEKLGEGVWMVSAKAIRQATDQIVAAYKAKLLGDGPVFDLCSGIGGDAIALARRGTVVTIDCDPQITAMAAANLHLARQRQAHRDAAAAPAASPPSGQAIAVCADVTRYPIPPRLAVHIDPDRRPDQRRTVHPANYQPPLDFVQSLVAGRVASIVKLAPAADWIGEPGGRELAQQHHRQWISFDRSVREQALLGGDAMAAAGLTGGGRSAVRLLRDGTVQKFAVGPDVSKRIDAGETACDTIDLPPEMIFDFDPAVRGSGLSAALAEARGLAAIGSPTGFFGGSALPPERSLLQSFQTLWSGPADRKQIKQELRKNGWCLQSVKVRGSDHDPAQLQRTLQPESRRLACNQGTAADPDNVTLLIGRHARGVYAVLARAILAVQ